ncbi:hypothetical protein K438DRAFT_64104 [Mycena galopus ATCC 62051]|nr:hypothetical protein K438DRAFT_64104 [Mycena galopus ATCC 62051]
MGWRGRDDARDVRRYPRCPMQWVTGGWSRLLGAVRMGWSRRCVLASRPSLGPPHFDFVRLIWASISIGESVRGFPPVACSFPLCRRLGCLAVKPRRRHFVPVPAPSGSNGNVGGGVSHIRGGGLGMRLSVLDDVLWVCGCACAHTVGRRGEVHAASGRGGAGLACVCYLLCIGGDALSWRIISVRRFSFPISFLGAAGDEGRDAVIAYWCPSESFLVDGMWLSRFRPYVMWVRSELVRLVPS